MSPRSLWLAGWLVGALGMFCYALLPSPLMFALQGVITAILFHAWYGAAR